MNLSKLKIKLNRSNLVNQQNNQTIIEKTQGPKTTKFIENP
jgi:hypothetical protein